MPATPDCLLCLVALTADGSDCFPLPTEAPADYTRSTEGLYLDVGPGLPGTGLGLTTAQFYQKLRAARATGLADTRAALTKALAARYQPAATWRGQLGKPATTGVAAPGAPARMQLDTQHRPGLALRILSVQLLTDQDVAGEISLQLDGVDVSVAANAGTLRIPLDGDTHTLSVALPAAVRARTTTIACGGCGSAAPLQPFLRNATAETAGLTVQAAIVCAYDVLCHAAQLGGPVRRDLAMAIYYKSLEVFALERLTNGSHAGSAQAGGLRAEDWSFLVERYAGKAAEFIDYLARPEGGLGLDKSPCYVCAPAGGPTLGKSY